MRQIILQVPRDHGDRVMRACREHEAVNVAAFRADGLDGPVDVVLAHVSNRRLEALLDALGDVDALRVTLDPSPVMALRPPRDETADQVQEVQLRSPLEVFLSGWQSVGSWTGYVGYALVSGAVTWIGLLTGKWYLLTAGMLIAPFAGPAMTLALATARGDGELARRSVVRYVVGLVASVVTAAALTAVWRINVPTNLMIAISEVSWTAPLLALVAGAAGALAQVQSRESSFVSGAAIGLLVAASLAPPAAIAGIAPVLGDWGMLKSVTYLLVLQLVGINVGASLLFRFLGGVDPQGVRYPHGRARTARALASATALFLVGLVAWQVTATPDLDRASLAYRAIEDVHETVRASGLAHPVRVDASFTRADVPEQHTLLVEIVAQPRSDANATRSEIESALRALVHERLARSMPHVTPLVDVTLLDPPRAR